MSSSRRVSCLLVSLLLACEADDEEGPRSGQFQVQLGGTETFLGIVLGDGELFAYACDGTPAGTTVSSWLVGTVDGDRFEAENPAGASMSGQIVGAEARGTFTSLAGDAYEFTASEHAAPSGLYFGERGEGSEEIWGGWILIDSEQRGAVVDRMIGDIIGNPSINPTAAEVDVDGAPLTYELVEEPIGETLDDVPPG